MRLQSSHIELVCRLARERVSQRDISQRVGISRDSVRRILAGKVTPAGRHPSPPFPIPPNRSRPPCRCPQCGGLVHMPCLACQLREYLARRQRPRGSPG